MTGHSEEEAMSQSVKEGREKHVSFPPDEQMVSDFVERRAELQEGEMVLMLYRRPLQISCARVYSCNHLSQKQKQH